MLLAFDVLPHEVALPKLPLVDMSGCDVRATHEVAVFAIALNKLFLLDVVEELDQGDLLVFFLLFAAMFVLDIVSIVFLLSGVVLLFVMGITALGLYVTEG